jgi:hypothetical protein
MSLQIKYETVLGVPVAPDSISQGSISLASPPVITGDFVVNISISSRTYTFDLRGISREKGTEITDICNANAEALAQGLIDIRNPSGQGQFIYNGVQCIPFSYQEGGTLQVGASSANYQSFQVTCLTNLVVVSA